MFKKSVSLLFGYLCYDTSLFILIKYTKVMAQNFTVSAQVKQTIYVFKSNIRRICDIKHGQ